MERRKTGLKKHPLEQGHRGAKLAALWIAGLAAVLASAKGGPAVSHHLQFHSAFTSEELSQWEFPRPEDWVSKTEDGRTYLHMVRPGEPGVPRRPLQFTRLKN